MAARGVLIGILVCSVIAVAWAVTNASWPVLLAAVALTILGAAGGALVAWMTELHRWRGRKWASPQRRTATPPGMHEYRVPSLTTSLRRRVLPVVGRLKHRPRRRETSQLR